jgi:hypothetical protein
LSYYVRSKVVLAQAQVSRALIADSLSSLEAFVHSFAGSLQKSTREVPNSLCARMAHFSSDSGQIVDDFFRDFSQRPFKISQKALDSRGDAMGAVFLGIVDPKPAAMGGPRPGPPRTVPSRMCRGKSSLDHGGKGCSPGRESRRLAAATCVHLGLDFGRLVPPPMGRLDSGTGPTGCVPSPPGCPRSAPWRRPSRRPVGCRRG